MSRGRAIAVRVLALVGLLSFSLMFVVVASEAAGVISMEPVGAPDDPPPSEAARQGATAPQEAVHVAGALAALAVGATGLIALVIRPDRAGSSYQVVSAAVGLLGVSPIVGNPDNYGGQAGAVDPAFVALAVPPLLAGLVGAPWREGVTRANTRPVLLLAAIALAPLVAFGVDQALLQRNTFPPTADPHHQAHWFAMASFAFVVVLVVATAALGATGWRLAATAASLSVVAVAVTSIANPDAASSFGRGWGGAALLWGAAVLAAVFSSAARSGAAVQRQ